MRFLQLIQQQTGISRRKARALIEAGRARIDGATVLTPFVEVIPEDVASLSVDGKAVVLKAITPGVYRYYKPRGMLCSFKDPHHHHAMGKVLRRPELRGYQVAGRLDRDAEGLLLLSNDGGLLNRLAHPRYGVEKVYHVLVPKVLRFRQTNEALRQMHHGIQDRGETLSIVRGTLLKRSVEGETTVVLVLNEGKNHEVKRLCKHFGWYVKQLTRVEMGGVQLGNLQQGQLRPLSHAEFQQLKSSLSRRKSSPTA